MNQQNLMEQQNTTEQQNTMEQQNTIEQELMKVLGVAMQENETFDEAHNIRVVAFNCSGIHFGIMAEEVFEILRTKELIIHKVPRTRAGIRGMVNLRGDILPVVSFRERYNQENKNSILSSSEGESVKFKRLVVVKANGIRFGLLVEQVVGMVRIDKESIEAVYVPMIAFSADYEGQPIYILKLDELF